MAAVDVEGHHLGTPVVEVRVLGGGGSVTTLVSSAVWRSSVRGVRRSSLYEARAGAS